MNRKAELIRISDEIEKCEICKKDKIGKAVPGEGSAHAEIVFVGEAPGRKEAESGRPFIGRSGNLLRTLIRETLGLKEEAVYITSPVKYLPEYVTPTKKDIAHGNIHFKKQLAVIRPKTLVLLGATACEAIFGHKIPVLKRHGEMVKGDGIIYFLTLHPAAAIRFQKFRHILQDDFQKLAKIVKQQLEI